MNNDLQCVKSFDELPDFVNSDDGFALRWAVMQGATETVDYLLKSGADPDVLNSFPIRRAISNGYGDIVIKILSTGSEKSIAIAEKALAEGNAPQSSLSAIMSWKMHQVAMNIVPDKIITPQRRMGSRATIA
jgi:hypothetical protein